MKQPVQFLRWPDVQARVRVSRSTWYHWVSLGTAPKPVKISPRVAAWRDDEINAWIEARCQQRGGSASCSFTAAQGGKPLKTGVG
ncbi:MAG: AlpA family phage regulatory protein [Pseudomonadota bacterium]